MSSDIGYVINGADCALRVDQEAVAQGKPAELLPRWPGDFVNRTDGTIVVAQEPIGELLGFGEGKVVGNGVERGANYDGLEGGKSLGAVTQALALSRSTSC